MEKDDRESEIEKANAPKEREIPYWHEIAGSHQDGWLHRDRVEQCTGRSEANLKHRAIIVGGGRIGAGFNWHDDAYTHAGAYRALSDRVELVAFVEPDKARAEAAQVKWKVPAYVDLSCAMKELKPDVVSICVQPEHQQAVFKAVKHYLSVKGVWLEKPMMLKSWPKHLPIQVNFLRRACLVHRAFARTSPVVEHSLVVYGKDDVHTRCHFEDLARWWKVSLDYRIYNGPCAYTCSGTFFDNGGINPADCMKRMLSNLLDAIEGKAELFSPPY